MNTKHNNNSAGDKLARYLSAAQHHQVHRKKKRRLPAQRAKWRFWIITVFIVLLLTGLYGSLTESGLLPTL